MLKSHYFLLFAAFELMCVGSAAMADEDSDQAGILVCCFRQFHGLGLGSYVDICGRGSTIFHPIFSFFHSRTGLAF